MIALFWDIDGTLLTTARAGVYSLEAALEQVCGRPYDLQGMPTAGMTDYAVAEAALAAVGHATDEGTVRRFLELHEGGLTGHLGRRQGRVLPNVREVLEDMAERDDVRSFLLTGNTSAGAAAKLAHYGLAEFFAAGGAFCTGPGDREAIARRALPFAAGADAVYVIGDTPADVACGKAIGARTVAVATGAYAPDALERSDPWVVLESLPVPRDFRALIGLD